MNKFCHLSLHSEYSINDSINLAFEWKIDKNKPILINLSDEKDSDNISLRGWSIKS